MIAFLIFYFSKHLTNLKNFYYLSSTSDYILLQKNFLFIEILLIEKNKKSVFTLLEQIKMRKSIKPDKMSKNVFVSNII